MGMREIYRNGGTPISNAIDKFFTAKDRATSRRLIPEAMSGKPEAMNQLMTVDPEAAQRIMYQQNLQKQEIQQQQQQEFQRKQQEEENRNENWNWS